MSVSTPCRGVDGSSRKRKSPLDIRLLRSWKNDTGHGVSVTGDKNRGEVDSSLMGPLGSTLHFRNPRPVFHLPPFLGTDADDDDGCLIIEEDRDGRRRPKNQEDSEEEEGFSVV